MSKCKACGEQISPELRYVQSKLAGVADVRAELDYCRECADEIFRGVVNKRPARLFAGGRLDVAAESWQDEGSPWQARAIRDYEGG